METLSLLPSSLDGSSWFTWVLLPLVIFVARTTDMSLSTLRIAFVAQGRTRLAALFGFFESLIWLLIIGEVLKRLDSPLCVIACAGGFATGSSVGIWIERRLAVGTRILRIISSQPLGDLPRKMRKLGLGVTVVDGQGSHGPVKILFSLVRRRDIDTALRLVRRQLPEAFYSIEDVRQASETPFAALRWGRRRQRFALLSSARKSK